MFSYSLAVAWEEHGKTIMLAAGVLTAVGVIVKAVVIPVVRAVRKVMAFVDRMTAVIDVVERELLSNNGGSTTKDKIEATHKRVDAIDQRLRRLEGGDETEGHFLKGGSNVRRNR